jgi:heme/copper-type cytochrome/quinol oxidase subunit 3
MLTRTPTRLRTLALTLWMTALLSGVPPTLLAQGQTPSRPASSPGSPQVVAPVEERDARETRQRLHEIFNQYPPSVGQVLRLDPSLLTKSEYMASYPTLAAFIAQHPEVAHNPGFFIGELRFDGSETPRGQALRVVENIFGNALFLIGVMSFFALVAWIARAVIEYRTWMRASKTQAETHAKLVDRLTSNEDLLAYLQSPVGQRATMSAARPVMEIAMRSVGAPVNRILWSVQVGVVLAAGGIGLWFAKGAVIEEAAQSLHVVAVLAVALGVGFVVSALVAYALSRQLGLLEPEPRSTHA